MSDDYDWTPHLQEGEEVLWQGRPDGRFRLKLTSNDGLFLFVVAFMFSIPTVGAIVAIWNLFSSRAGFGELFVTSLFCAGVAGLGMQPALTDRNRRHRYRYAVTNRRALRLDVVTDVVLTERTLEASTQIDLIGKEPKTVRVGPWVKDGKPLWAVMPNNKNGMQPTGTGIIASMFERRQTLCPSSSKLGVKTGGDGIQSFNGYDDVGLEFRMIQDASSVAALLRSLIAKQKATNP